MFCFSEPNAIGKCGENSVAALKYQSNEEKNADKNTDKIQAYPFTFIGAVKQKLAVAAKNELCKRISTSDSPKPLDPHTQFLRAEKMEFIKPLKVPDMKISPKSSDYSPRENSNQRNKLNPSKESQQKIEKNIKLSLAQRKLDFSESESTSFITNDEIESLKVPNISFSPSISKKKESRDSSREKENRSKKIRTNGSTFSKDGEGSDTLKHRNFKHISRKDLETIVKKSKNERFTSNSPVDSESTNSMSKKCQKKLLPTTNAKKDSRSTSSYSSKSRERSSESRGRNFSTEAVLDRNSKTREISRISGYDNSLQKQNDDYSKHNRVFLPKEITNKKQSDKSKPSPNKIHSRYASTNSELSEEIGTTSDGINVTKLKTKKLRDNERNLKFNAEKVPGESSEELLMLDPRRISFRDDSYSNQDEFSNLVTPDLNLVYHRPKRGKKDAKNPLQISQIDSESESSVAKGQNSENERDNGPLIHPSALHMQFQAELHLFDSYNESLRQVMDVENCLYNVKQDKKRDSIEKKGQTGSNQVNQAEKKGQSGSNQINQAEQFANHEVRDGKQPKLTANPEEKEAIDNSNDPSIIPEKKSGKEVQTQTVNDIATQTELFRNHEKPKFYPGITYNRGEGSALYDLGHLSLNSIDEFGDLDRLEEISLPSKIRTMSEISLHETTSSIKTETGTEISISTRDVTCSFNKYLDLEMAQLIKDEKHMYDKIEMLFKSREKTLNDRTKKLVELEEQKRALRDTGQDSRISSVKKKQRALLLKLQQEKEEMNRLKELHKLASQERKLMLQKQRNMFNPQMSTKNILTKLKRSADCHSPRRLSGPMKGYDIRSNSSVSSLLDSDKSQLDKSRPSVEKTELNPLQSSKITQDSSNNSSQIESPQKYEVRARKFEEKMPKADLLRLKAHYFELGSKFIHPRNDNLAKILTVDDVAEEKTESDTLVEDKGVKRDNVGAEDIDIECGPSKKSRGVQVNEEKSQKIGGEPLKFFNLNSKKKVSKTFKGKSNGNLVAETLESQKHSKKTRESERNSISQLLEANNSQCLIEHSNVLDEENKKNSLDSSNENGGKEGDNGSGVGEDSNEKNQRHEPSEDAQGLGNISTRSQVSTFTISRHSSGDSEKSYSRSVVIRSQDHRFKASKKLEQVLNAREAAVSSRRNCVEDWISWHARLKAEESRVARMEEAAYKLVSATTNSALYHDTTFSSDTSDVEGRVELLAEKLSEKRAEMAKLRKEARRQARQRLKALEANLLTQIKKYDTTINEMRKKLDSKKGGSTKQHEKLAIEPRNILPDSKAPEISFKKIQDIYRNNDPLLHSRSESDIITGALKKSSSTELSSNLHEYASSMKPLSRSIESVLEEAKRHSSRSSTLEKVRTTVSEENFTDYCEDLESAVINQSESPSKLRENSSRNSPNEKSGSNSIPEEIKEIKGNDEDSIFSKRIDYLQLNNKNLNNDISNLANDLKTLSEMMSKFSDKSGEKSKLVKSASVEEKEDTESSISIGKSTSKDITEDLLKSETEEIKTVNESGKSENPENRSNSEIIKTVEEAASEIISANIPEEVASEVISATIPEEMPSEIPSEIISAAIPEEESAKNSEIIDFEARSKEILNEIEKSIISEHVKSNSVNNLELSGAAIEKSLENLHKENVALSSDFNSLEGDIKSISEMISKMTECKESLGLIAESHETAGSSNEEMIDSSSALSLSEHSSNPELDEEPESSEIDNKIDDEIEISMGSETSTFPSAAVRSQSEKVPVEEELEIDLEIDAEMSVHEERVDSPENYADQEQESSTIDQFSGEKDAFKEDETDLMIPELFDVANASENKISSIGEEKSHEKEEKSEEKGEKEEKSEKRGEEEEKSEEKGEKSEEEGGEEKNADTFIKTADFSNFTTTEIIENSSIFLQKDESTIIAGGVGGVGAVFAPEDSSFDGFIKPREAHTDELDDIIDIIERDSRQPQESSIIAQLNVPDELRLEIRDNPVPQSLNALNLTADVEPVLQKLTEILISVERNIARKTEEKKTPSSSVSDEKGGSDEKNGEKNEKEVQKEENVDINYENLVETDIDKSEINEHLDEALNQLNIEEEKAVRIKERRNEDESSEFTEKKDVNNLEKIIDKSGTKEVFSNKIPRIPDIIRDPEYEDISEESLEVSEILDKSESARSSKSSRIPEKYQVIGKTDEVLRILEEISLKNKASSENKASPTENSVNLQLFDRIDPEMPGIVIEELDASSITNDIDSDSEKSGKKATEPLIEEKISEDSSDGGETSPREPSDIDSNSPRDQNDSRLDIEALDDDLLASKSQLSSEISEKDEKMSFLSSETGIGTSEKDIEMIIDKLRASLHQPGLEVAELDARLLKIEQLQIELQIKKLEAEEDSYFAREIPNKPPPPYTPPRGVRMPSSPQSSLNIPPAVVPTNVEELTAFTEKATVIIYNAKCTGEEIIHLEAPLEILEANKETNEVAKRDRKIYNTFLFDLCKETIADIYHSEFEKSGPSWTKPNVKTKPAIKIPRNIQELTEYVNKEVATLFGFKTKLQRENMVMRWSRKRRDRVDELLAREAQAEEDEWTKFHHDELAVKNELTIAILDTLIMETTGVVRDAFNKKLNICI